jgi:hypothetical protein
VSDLDASEGAEIRVEAGGEFVGSEAGGDPLALIERATEWQNSFKTRAGRGSKEPGRR